MLRIFSLLFVFLLSGCAGKDLVNKPAKGMSGRMSAAEVDESLARAKHTLTQILNVKGPRTIDNTLVLYNELLLDLGRAFGNVAIYAAVHPNKEIRDKALQQEQILDKFSAELSLNRKLYDALAAVDVSAADQPTQFFHKKTMQSFRRSGVNLDDVTRQKISQIKEELSKITQSFSKNIRDDVRYVYAKPSQLKGLPKDFIESRKPEKDGRIKISTNYPDVFPVLRYADDYNLRRKIYVAFSNRAYPKNSKVLMNMIKKRYELARTLGYKNWAHYAIEDKMMKSHVSADRFINRIASMSKKRAKKDYQELLTEKRKRYKRATKIHSWDKGYWANKVKESKYKLDAQKVRQYFEFNRVKAGVFNITEKLLGVRFEKVEDVELWHEDVEAWDIFEGKKQLGRFYLDLFPRDNKYKHAAHFTLRAGITGVQLPESTLVTNFPSPKENSPALMEHSQVETFLHEFGHLLHNMFAGHQDWAGNSGVKTERDFVEVPSQIFEEWVWDFETLQGFAKHHKTNEPLPKELYDKMKTAKEFGVGLRNRQQMFYAALSLNLYNRNPSKVNLSRMERQLQAKYSPFDYVPGTHFSNNFGHLNGYSAFYYTYMWSEVIARDLFSEFEKNGMFHRATAERFKNTILRKGGSNYAAELVKDFLGRPFSDDAFRKYLNKF